tara:strand:+ start:244 stop:645 length:402 start_codon:yes stop_codon:yes gene_type:complete
MIILSNLFKGVNTSKSTETIIELCRLHFSSPGLILRSSHIRGILEDITDKIKLSTNIKPSSNILNININNKTGEYDVIIDDLPLREWIAINGPNVDDVANMRVYYPKSLTKESAVMEILYEISYNKLIEIGKD